MMQQMLFSGSSPGITYAGYDVNKAGEYLIVPFLSDGSISDLLFIDSTTGEVEERIPNIGYSGHLYRFGTNILNMSSNSSWELWSALTLQKIATGQIATSFTADSVKFASDKILTLGWENTSGNTTATAYTHSVSNSGLTQIASNTATNMGVRNSTYGMINNPVIAGQATINSSTGILSSMGTIGTKAPNEGTAAPSARGSMTVNSSGTSIGFNGSTNFNSNFSRPVAATGGNGYCLITGMDGAETHIFTGNGPGTAISGNGVFHPPVTGFSPAAVLGTNTWIMVRDPINNGNPKCSLMSSGGFSDLFTPPQFPYGMTVQSIPGGAAFVYIEYGQVKIRKYLASGGLQTPIVVTLLPGTVSSSTKVNNTFAFKKIINY
jgi:hypothetical protein